MNLQAILEQFTSRGRQGGGGSPANICGLIPEGLAGGAVAGGLMALLVGNKSARKFAGKAATFGGAALLGGLAYKAYRNWQSGRQDGPSVSESGFVSADLLSSRYQLTLVKAMIAAARADGHIDTSEQQRIFNAVQQMDLSTELKVQVFDLLRQPIAVGELAMGATTLEQKSELYLASCLVADPDHPAGAAHLDALAQALELPQGLSEQLELQARQALAEV